MKNPSYLATFGKSLRGRANKTNWLFTNFCIVHVLCGLTNLKIRENVHFY
ncbi:hypothetical protein LSP03_01840 [Lysinibacillus sphaericus]|nr:hypothetical protein LSP03_01840 [Lysinibacillus sphaericus]